MERHLAPVEADALQVLALHDLGFKESRQCVNHARADAVQSSGYLVGAGVELPARVKLSEDHFDRRTAFTLHHADGDDADVISVRGAAVSVYRYLYLVC